MQWQRCIQPTSCRSCANRWGSPLSCFNKRPVDDSALHSAARPRSERAPLTLQSSCHAITICESLGTQCDCPCDGDKTFTAKATRRATDSGEHLNSKVRWHRYVPRERSPALHLDASFGSGLRTLTNAARKDISTCMCKVSGVLLCSRCHCAPCLNRQSLEDSSRESSPLGLIRELLEGAEGDKHPCSRIRVEVSRMLGHDSGAEVDNSR